MLTRASHNLIIYDNYMYLHNFQQFFTIQNIETILWLGIKLIRGRPIAVSCTWYMNTRKLHEIIGKFTRHYEIHEFNSRIYENMKDRFCKRLADLFSSRCIFSFGLSFSSATLNNFSPEILSLYFWPRSKFCKIVIVKILTTPRYTYWSSSVPTKWQIRPCFYMMVHEMMEIHVYMIHESLVYKNLWYMVKPVHFNTMVFWLLFSHCANLCDWLLAER